MVERILQTLSGCKVKKNKKTHVCTYLVGTHMHTYRDYDNSRTQDKIQSKLTKKMSDQNHQYQPGQMRIIFYLNNVRIRGGGVIISPVHTCTCTYVRMYVSITFLEVTVKHCLLTNKVPTHIHKRSTYIHVRTYTVHVAGVLHSVRSHACVQQIYVHVRTYAHEHASQ